MSAMPMKFSVVPLFFFQFHNQRAGLLRRRRPFNSFAVIARGMTLLLRECRRASRCKGTSAYAAWPSSSKPSSGGGRHLTSSKSWGWLDYSGHLMHGLVRCIRRECQSEARTHQSADLRLWDYRHRRLPFRMALRDASWLLGREEHTTPGM